MIVFDPWKGNMGQADGLDDKLIPVQSRFTVFVHLSDLRDDRGRPFWGRPLFPI
jgi:hypothetical protein